MSVHEMESTARTYREIQAEIKALTEQADAPQTADDPRDGRETGRQFASRGIHHEIQRIPDNAS